MASKNGHPPPMPQPVRTLGLALCCLGSLGLAKQFVLFLVAVPLAVWTSLAVFLTGLTLVLGEELQKLLAEGTLHQLPGQIMRQQMQTGQRLYVLAALSSPSREDVRIILSGISPLLAAVLTAENYPEAFAVIVQSFAGFLPIDLLTGLVEKVRAWLHSSGVLVSCSCSTASCSSSLTLEPEESSSSDSHVVDVSEAVAWLRRPQLTLSFDDQLQLYGLARQACDGDAPEHSSSGRRLPLAKHQSWSIHRGTDRQEAGKRLVERLLEIDPVFCSSHRPSPEAVPARRQQHRICAKIEPSSTADIVGMLAALIERRLPADADTRAARGKYRALALLVLSSFLLGLIRRGKLLQRSWKGLKRVPVLKLTGAAAGAYACALSFGLPAQIYVAMPKPLRRLPGTATEAAESVLGTDGASRLMRWVVQCLLPPVSRPLLQE